MSSCNNYLDNVRLENGTKLNCRVIPAGIRCSHPPHSHHTTHPTHPTHTTHTTQPTHPTHTTHPIHGHTGPIGYRGHTGCKGPKGYTGPRGQMGYKGVGTFNLKTVYSDIEFPRDNQIEKVTNTNTNTPEKPNCPQARVNLRDLCPCQSCWSRMV